MRKYVIDTNLYIRATRDRVANEALEAFLSASAPWIYLHSVVAQELMAGAVTAQLQRRTEAGLLRPFERRGRVITPDHAAWKRAGEGLAQLIRRKKLSPNGIKPSFVNDCLIAASARDHGFTLVTENARDFSIIDQVLPIDFVGPWPDASSSGQ